MGWTTGWLYTKTTTDRDAGAGDARSAPTLDNDASQREASIRCPRSVLVSNIFSVLYSLFSLFCLFVRPCVAELF